MEINRDKYKLRNWTLADAASLAYYANNINIWNHLRDAFPHPYTQADGEAFISMVLQRNAPQEFAIEIGGKAVGGIGFVPGQDVERLSAEIGYWLGQAFWNKGIMTSALHDLTEYVFSHTEIIRLFAFVFETNTASQYVLEKNGFRKAATLRKAVFKNGQIMDMFCYELLK
ncbi:MAG: GNAT family N-acetyltransferase [Dysgonomonas sp.]